MLNRGHKWWNSLNMQFLTTHFWGTFHSFQDPAKTLCPSTIPMRFISIYFYPSQPGIQLNHSYEGSQQWPHRVRKSEHKETKNLQLESATKEIKVKALVAFPLSCDWQISNLALPVYQVSNQGVRKAKGKHISFSQL